MSGSGRVHRKASLPRRALTRPAVETTTEAERNPEDSHWHTRDGSRTRRSRALLRRLPPVRAESGGVAPLPEGPATANRRASAVGRAAAPDGDAGPGDRRFPSVAGRQGRSTGTAAGRPSTGGAANGSKQRSSGRGRVDQSVSTRTPLSARHACCFLLPPDRSRIAPGPARSVLWSVPAQRPTNWGPSDWSTRWDGRPELPGIRPGRDGPAAEPRERGFRAAIPRPRPVDVRSEAALRGQPDR
jgi:hypothetical protein